MQNNSQSYVAYSWKTLHLFIWKNVLQIYEVAQNNFIALDECVLQHQHDSNSNYSCFNNQATQPISCFFLAKSWFVSIFML
jgi:hypothetical protein